MTQDLRWAIVGCLLGTAVGDALGLPYEGLTRDRQQVLYPVIDRHQLVFGKGMISDDTEHTCFVAQALIASAGNVDKFRDEENRRWILRVRSVVAVA
jgi:ADP-ribosyl-[dinitrogen reductase] hydrolase